MDDSNIKSDAHSKADQPATEDVESGELADSDLEQVSGGASGQNPHVIHNALYVAGGGSR